MAQPGREALYRDRPLAGVTQRGGRRGRQRLARAGDLSLLGFAEPSASSVGLKLCEDGEERKRGEGLAGRGGLRPGLGQARTAS